MQADLIHVLQNLFPHPGKKIARRSGYLKDQHGIMNRYLRELDNWKPHLEHCRRFIKEQLHGINMPLVVLGSGWLLDFPEDLLTDTKKPVYLIDINHPPQIEKKYSRQENIHFISGDVTGGIIAFAYGQSNKCKGNELAKRLLSFQSSAFQIDSVVIISLNIVTQLDALLCDFLKQKKKLNDEQCSLVRDHIQKSHLQLLQMNRHVLITDFEEWSYADSNNKTKANLIDSSFLHSPKEEWWWFFDHSGYYKKGRKTDMRVAAFSQLEKKAE